MLVVSLNNIAKSYGVTDVLIDFSLHVNQGERVGLIGSNGCGKTTVFKIIAGFEPYSSGNLSLKRGIEIGYLSQLPDFEDDWTIIEELRTNYLHLIEMEKKLRFLEEKMAVSNNNIDHDKLMKKYSELQHSFEREGGYGYESKIKKVALGMGFTEEELNQRIVNTLSGGEKTRLGLIKLLLSEPDLLLLDEPTNHLDLSSIQWLEDYLSDYQGTVIAISHDRYFLDKVVERIVELRDGKNEEYNGTYTYYLEERKRRFEQRLHEYENQQKKIKKMEEAIERLYVWGRSADNAKFFKRAKSMEKSLNKIDRIDKPILDGKQMGLDLSVDERSGKEVLTIRDLDKGFNKEQIIKDLNLNLYWGEKAAIIGKNGSGKTSLLKMILGDYQPDSGEIKVGSNVKIGYYSQEFEGFNPDDDLLTALRRECSMTTAEARNALAAFLFTEDEVFKKVADLSGGEKSRLRLLQLMNGSYNFLILDEPTNHLDLPSREILEEALAEYSGTVMVVSHDRYFLNKIIELTYELINGSLIKYYGNYDYYRKKKEDIIQEKDKIVDEKKPEMSDYHKLKEKARQERQRKNSLANIEEEIETKEVLIKEIEEEMTAPENITDIKLLNKLKTKYDKLKQGLAELYEEWESYI
ncbi:MAG: ABC-F type ribosomal protection protein [Firmicutes bacterium]|nr:ABC-F type ribosomal protection protein [Bacillota bacterium]